MNKKKKKIIRYSIIAAALVLVLAIVLVSYTNREVVAKQIFITNEDAMEFSPFVENEERLDNSLLVYGKVLTKYAQRGYKDYKGDAIVIDPSSFVTGVDGEGKVQLFKDVYPDGYSYKTNETTVTDGKSVTTEVTKVVSSDEYPEAIYVSADSTVLTYVVNVPEDGLYSLQIDYLLTAGKNTEMLVGFYSGKEETKLPFSEASYIQLQRKYEFYATEEFDVSGNQIRPKQQETYMWQKYTVSHPEGLYKGDYKIFLEAGENNIRFTFDREAGAIGRIAFVAPSEYTDYDDYLTENGFSDSNIYDGETLNIQMEIPQTVTDIKLRMQYDDNYYSYPASYDVIKYNIFGGDLWNSGGDTVSWSFDVPKTGWYKIGFRYYSTMTYVAAFREIRIDGEIPFAQMQEYRFPYSDGWIGDCFKDENNDPYMFYLEEGTHTITMRSKIGPLRHQLQRMQECVDSITNLVNQVVKITASARNSSGAYVVDKGRDWDLQDHISTIQEDLEAYEISFKLAYQKIKEVNGGKNPAYASAVQVAYELFEKLAEDLEEVPGALNDITNAVTGVSNTMVSIKEQPMFIDFMMLSSDDAGYTKVRSNIWQNLFVGVRRFAWSWVKDYSLVGTREDFNTDSLTEIEVYVSRGREHVDILRNLISEQFTPETGIKVNVNMVAGSSEGLIMPRYVAGTAPDVAISIGMGTPFEFAIRGALLPLDEFEDFDELMAEGYSYSSLIPLRFQGHYYGFPETMNWSALFYRTDIMESLELDPPDTWQDVYSMLPILQENGYDFCFNYGEGNYTPFLLQYGGNYYDSEGMKSALNTNAAYQAFMEYADLYVRYNIIYQANFYNRFRAGSMPIGIAGMDLYCQLNYSAPELNGKWTIAPIPGHTVTNAEGSTYVDRSYGGTASCSVIISSTDEKEASWEFIKWWSSTEVQVEYGREVEATFGVASRWNPANINAVAALEYTQDEFDVIKVHFDNLVEVPSVLGGYYTSRYLKTALNQTVLQSMNARVALEDAVKEINKEMLRKQKEFRIPEDGSVLNDLSAK